MPIQTILKNAFVEIEGVACRFNFEQHANWKVNRDTILNWIDALASSSSHSSPSLICFRELHPTKSRNQEIIQNIDTGQNGNPRMDANAELLPYRAGSVIHPPKTLVVSIASLSKMASDLRISNGFSRRPRRSSDENETRSDPTLWEVHSHSTLRQENHQNLIINPWRSSSSIATESSTNRQPLNIVFVNPMPSTLSGPNGDEFGVENCPDPTDVVVLVNECLSEPRACEVDDGNPHANNLGNKIRQLSNNEARVSKCDPHEAWCASHKPP
ncbi:hypothetical protein R1flu_027126 [Riccia fluitans]|uniref:Uncharacterized protein n=1 Tax=Riccia fluitans TaxID=41844 RepID=A0ABD1XIM6_9MARC